jgi:uncharacterized membrane protein YheB (UPF0754 family)
MTDEPAPYPRFAGKISVEQGTIRETLIEQRSQLGAMSDSLIDMRGDLKTMAQEIATVHLRADRIEDRLESIEKRSGLIEA